MSFVEYLRRWWEINARFFGAVHRVADTVAGLAFVLLVVLAPIAFRRPLGLSLPLPSELLVAGVVGFWIAAALFALAVAVQTGARLRAFFASVRLRILDAIRK